MTRTLYVCEPVKLSRIMVQRETARGKLTADSSSKASETDYSVRNGVAKLSARDILSDYGPDVLDTILGIGGGLLVAENANPKRPSALSVGMIDALKRRGDKKNGKVLMASKEGSLEPPQRGANEK